MVKEVHLGLTKPAAKTGATVFKTPPPATPLPGIKGNPPLPVGRPVSTALYTEAELSTLQSIPGWKPGDDPPDGLADIIAEVLGDDGQNIRDYNVVGPPVDPATPPLNVPEAVDLNRLPPEKRREILARLNQLKVRRQAEMDMAEQLVPGAAPGLNEAIQGQNVREITLADDTQSNTIAGTDIPKSALKSSERTQSPTTETTEPVSGTGADARIITNCPRCDFDLTKPDSVEVTDGDKQRFLMASLGNQPFQRIYKLLNDSLIVTLRELRPPELDAIYRQVYSERQRNLIASPQDFFETLMRYRLCLQLVDLRTVERVVTFPDSLKAWGGDAVPPNPTTLPTILDKVTEDAIATESLQRMLGNLLSEFNRLVAKLEANSQTPDFWKGTAPAT